MLFDRILRRLVHEMSDWSQDGAADARQLAISGRDLHLQKRAGLWRGPEDFIERHEVGLHPLIEALENGLSNVWSRRVLILENPTRCKDRMIDLHRGDGPHIAIVHRL